MSKELSKTIYGGEKLLTLPEAAAQLGVPVSTLRRAVKAGHIPTHTVFNQRKRVRLSDIFDAMLAQEAEAQFIASAQEEEAGENGF